jgi:putative hydrolase
MDLARDLGCRFAIDSDAHAPGQLAWLRLGCEKATTAGLDATRIVNSLSATDLVQWARSHDR